VRVPISTSAIRLHVTYHNFRPISSPATTPRERRNRSIPPECANSAQIFAPTRLILRRISAPTFVRSEFSYPSFQHPRTWIKNRRVAGGGPIADVGVHCIDVWRFVLQDEVACIHACGFQDQESGEVEAAAVLSLQFRKSTLATVLVSTRTEYRTPLEFVGETGTLRVDDALSVERAVCLEVRRRGAALQTEEIINHLAYARQVDAFAAAVEGKAKFPVPGEEGWRNQLVLDAAYRSLQTGKSEPTPDL